MQTNEYCLEIHRILNAAPRYTYDKLGEISNYGCTFVMFEKGEVYHGLDRIVLVGAVSKPERIIPRIRQIMKSGTKDGAIYRKYIGAAMLANAGRADLLQYWKINLSNKKLKSSVNDPDIIQQLREHECAVSDYICNNFSVVVIPETNPTTGTQLKETIIATLFQADDFHASENWLGHTVPQLVGKHTSDWGIWHSKSSGAPADDTTIAYLRDKFSVYV